MVPNRSLVIVLEDLADCEGEVLVNLARNRIYVPRGLVICGKTCGIRSLWCIRSIENILFRQVTVPTGTRMAVVMDLNGTHHRMW